MPAKSTLDGIAAVTGQPYLTVLKAVLRDTGYLDDQDADAPAAT
ncbi:hypothetical protein [Williamsia sp. 1135]|nr:hypothetical protein [Williamsia sp. 1135]